MNRRTLDVSDLPNVVFGYRGLLWWGTLGLAVIEGAMFAILIASYFYLRSRTSDWPPGVMPPAMLYGVLQVICYALSVVPAVWVQKAANKGDLRKVQLGLIVLGVFGLLSLGLRVGEFASLNVKWNSNAYGSVVWMLLGAHTVHLLTDWYDTLVLTVIMFRPSLVEGKRFMDTSENSDYWYFVVLAWLPVWFTIYVAPRIL